jgi:hypothetical protein
MFDLDIPQAVASAFSCSHSPWSLNLLFASTLKKKHSNGQTPSGGLNKRVKYWTRLMQLLPLLWKFRFNVAKNHKLGLSLPLTRYLSCCQI